MKKKKFKKELYHYTFKVKYNLLGYDVYNFTVLAENLSEAVDKLREMTDGEILGMEEEFLGEL